MKFGKDRKNTKQLFTINDVTGIGEEEHPFVTKNNVKEPVGYLELPSEETDPVKKKVFDIIKNQINGNIKEEIKEVPKNKRKLDLNSIINLLFNNHKNVHKEGLVSKLKTKFVTWWRRDTTDDMKELISFVLIHGFLTAPCILAILTITNVDINIVNLIRRSSLITILIYLIGGGSGYYLFLDVNKALMETWRKKKK